MARTRRCRAGRGVSLLLDRGEQPRPGAQLPLPACRGLRGRADEPARATRAGAARAARSVRPGSERPVPAPRRDPLQRPVLHLLRAGAGGAPLPASSGRRRQPHRPMGGSDSRPGRISPRRRSPAVPHRPLRAPHPDRVAPGRRRRARPRECRALHAAQAGRLRDGHRGGPVLPDGRGASPGPRGTARAALAPADRRRQPGAGARGRLAREHGPRRPIARLGVVEDRWAAPGLAAGARSARRGGGGGPLRRLPAAARPLQRRALRLPDRVRHEVSTPRAQPEGVRFLLVGSVAARRLVLPPPAAVDRPRLSVHHTRPGVSRNAARPLLRGTGGRGAPGHAAPVVPRGGSVPGVALARGEVSRVRGARCRPRLRGVAPALAPGRQPRRGDRAVRGRTS